MNRSSPRTPRSQFITPAQLCSFLVAQAQKIEESVGSFYVLKDIADVGAIWEKRVDDCNQFAFIGKHTLLSVASGTAPGRPGADTRNVATDFTLLIAPA